MTTRTAARKSKHATLAAVAAVLALTTAACGSSSGDAPAPGKAAGTTAPSGPVDSAAKALLPEDLKSGGTLAVGAEIGGPPGQYFAADGTTITGFGFDLGEALAARLGVQLTWKNMSFDGLIPASKSGRINMIISSMSDTKTRQSQLTFVDYFQESTGIMVAAGNPKKVNSLESLCGLIVGVKPGTSSQKIAAQASENCTKNGKPAITVRNYPNNAAIDLQLKSGNIDATMDDLSGLGYVAKTFGDGKIFEIAKTDKPIEAGPLGIGLPKADTKLAAAMQAALNSMIKDGTYGKILDKYGVGSGGVKTATINSATS